MLRGHERVAASEFVTSRAEFVPSRVKLVPSQLVARLRLSISQ